MLHVCVCDIPAAPFGLCLHQTEDAYRDAEIKVEAARWRLRLGDRILWLHASGAHDGCALQFRCVLCGVRRVL